MILKGEVHYKGEPAGEIMKTQEGEYIFRYYDTYFSNPAKKAISLTLPKRQKEYRSKFLFPFFFNMLSEGVNKQLQCRQLRIDENDYFRLLLATSGVDTIGAVTIKPLAS
jgi:HipA-like protein